MSPRGSEKKMCKFLYNQPCPLHGVATGAECLACMMIGLKQILRELLERKENQDNGDRGRDSHFKLPEVE